MGGGYVRREVIKMKTNRYINHLPSRGQLLGALLLSMMMIGSLAFSAFADDKQAASQLVEKARMTLQNFMIDSNMGAFRDLIKEAKGVLIVPEQVKGGFIVGASGGSGRVL